MNTLTMLMIIVVALISSIVLFWLALAAIIFIGAATVADAHDEDFEEPHRRNK